MDLARPVGLLTAALVAVLCLGSVVVVLTRTLSEPVALVGLVVAVGTVVALAVYGGRRARATATPYW